MLASLHTFPAQPIDPAPHHRRVSRLRETNRDVVLRAVPEGSVRAAHGTHVQKALTQHPEYPRHYTSRQTTLRTVLAALIARADYETMTTRPGWAYLTEQTGKSRRTIARALATLRTWGLIGIVASGRTAAYASLNENGERTNEAAVYVLCTPSPLTIIHSPTNDVVDENGTPPALGGSHLKVLKETHTRARGKHFSGAATPPEIISGGSAAKPHPAPYRPELLWPAHKTTKSKKQRIAAASELRRRVFLLRPMSIKDIASSLRDFLVCGWTIADIHHALDHQPDGTPWPHDGVPADANAPRLRGWLRYRLGAWRTTTGEPRRSRDQQRTNEATENRAAAIKVAHQAKKELEERAARVGQDSPAKSRAMAQIRALFNTQAERR
ncbi:helix-turn-helix domain-containing protein [Arthrobacter rhombi]|uniref:helix-turn-helix domain-containing protein n=1 Tax=Arthrobacter rhombi TaxID=71253 RepID=UPI003FCFFF7E